MAARRRSTGLPPAFGAGLLLAAALPAAPARGDIFHLTNGDDVEAQLLEDLGEAYRLRTRIGIVDVEKQRVARISRRPSPWQRYARKRKQCAASAEDHFELALWCERQGLRAERFDELERVIELDPDHRLARRALGFVREAGGRWARPPAPDAPDADEREARRLRREEERLVRKLITDWFVTIKAVYRGRLAGKSRDQRHEQFRKGREQILAIRDPLALPALTGVLSAGNSAVRLVLVEALARFSEDEATMNLLVMALMDPSPTVRERAALALAPREDDRVVLRLRQALESDDEGLLRNAASALGTLKAHEAIDDLIQVLSKQVRRTVRVSRPAYLGGIRTAFGGRQRIAHGRRLLGYQPTSIGVLGAGSIIGTHTYYQKQTVSIYRTEVQEALIAITGRNFGFDAEAWRRWHREP